VITIEKWVSRPGQFDIPQLRNNRLAANGSRSRYSSSQSASLGKAACCRVSAAKYHLPFAAEIHGEFPSSRDHHKAAFQRAAHPSRRRIIANASLCSMQHKVVGKAECRVPVCATQQMHTAKK
jgi:hypothetical protein